MKRGCSLDFALLLDLGNTVCCDLTTGGAFRLEAGYFEEPRMATTDSIQERIEAFARQLCAEMGEVDDRNGDCWLDAVENQAIEIGDAIAVALVKQKSGEFSAADESTCPQCGKPGRYRGDREREMLTRRGPATIHEPEYYCPCCRKAFFPADRSDRR